MTGGRTEGVTDGVADGVTGGLTDGVLTHSIDTPIGGADGSLGFADTLQPPEYAVGENDGVKGWAPGGVTSGPHDFSQEGQYIWLHAASRP